MDYQTALRLDGRGVVVMGAGQGIGLEASRALASQGAIVLCVDRDEALAMSAAKEAAGHAFAADATRESDVAAVFAKANELFGDSFSGVVDIVGRSDLRAIKDFSEDEWDAQFNLILKHAFFSIKHAAISLPRGGSVTFVSSLAGIRAIEGQGVYGAAKAALNHLITSAALELGPADIRVNAVAPGLTSTPRVSDVLGETGFQSIAKLIPLRRVNTPADIAATILFLSSDLSRCISGAVIPVDGGITNVSAFPKLAAGDRLLNAGQ